jgi:hypothetical protein
MALVRVTDSEQEAAMHLTSPKSGKVRSVPMAPKVAETVARLSHREYWTGDDDLFFVDITGSYLDGSALSKRYRAALERAALRPLRFPDLRHTFGTRGIGVAGICRVQEWMGHANVHTTMQYLHYVPCPQAAALVDEAFATGVPRRGGRFRRGWPRPSSVSVPPSIRSKTSRYARPAVFPLSADRSFRGGGGAAGTPQSLGRE